jgi:abortive infection bacteriophage resistance protein
MSLKKFQKPSLSSQDHISLLTKRGLSINEPKQAQHYLEYVGYYRLSGYFKYFYDDKIIADHRFHQVAKFGDIVDLYEFDTSLRAILLSSLERIEIAARATISNYMSQKYDAHWYLNRNLFKKSYDYNELVKQVKKETDYDARGGKKLIFRHYYNTYDSPELPASWMIAEALSFGIWSKIYAYLSKDSDRHNIAKKFGLPYPIFGSWLQAVSVLRNLCAHHSMICYRNFHFIPMKPVSWPTNMQQIFSKQTSLSSQIFVIHFLLKSIMPNNDLILRLSKLFNKYPKISLANMGFDVGWEKYEVWK